MTYGKTVGNLIDCRGLQSIAMSPLTEQEIRAGFALLELETEDQRARFTRFRNIEPLNGDEEFVCVHKKWIGRKACTPANWHAP